MFEILLILVGQLLLYFLPQISWGLHWYLWLIPPILAGFIAPSLRRGLLASLIASMLYVIIVGLIEGVKYGSWIVGLVFGLFFGFPVMLIVNTFSLVLVYGLKYGLKRITKF